MAKKQLRQKAERATKDAVGAMTNALILNRAANGVAAEPRTTAEADTQAKLEKREKEMEACKITREEIRGRVRKFRQYVERCKARSDGAIFDVVSAGGGVPRSLDSGEEVDITEVVYGLDPELKLRRGYCDDALSGVGSDDLWTLFYDGVELAHQLGVFTGLVFATDSQALVDRAEQGLAFSCAARRWIVKKDWDF